MSEPIKTEYLRPDSALPPYLMFPRFLLGLELPDGAKLLYILLLDRARLSMQNPGWTDEAGRVYLIYTIRDLSAAMRRSEGAMKNGMRALEQAGLICRTRQGLGQPNRLFVRIPKAENCPSDRQKSVRQRGRNLSTNKNDNKKNNIPSNYVCEEGESL